MVIALAGRGRFVADMARDTDADLIAHAPTDLAAMHAALTAVEAATDLRTLTHTLMRHWGYDDEDIAKAEKAADDHDALVKTDPHTDLDPGQAVTHLYEACGAAEVFEEHVRRAVEAELQPKEKP